MLTLLFGCTETGPEARLRDALAQLEQAVEDRAPGDFVDWLSADFHGGAEGLDRAALRGLLATQMLGKQRIEVVVSTPEIRLHGDRATLTVEVTVFGGRWFADRAQRLRIVSGWRIEHGEWRCYTAQWNPVG